MLKVVLGIIIWMILVIITIAFVHGATRNNKEKIEWVVYRGNKQIWQLRKYLNI